MPHERFINKILELKESNSSPIYGYEHMPILSLEESVQEIKTLVPEVLKYVATAKEKCNHDLTLLTKDESAAIYLYTMQTRYLECLNSTLRSEKRNEIEPWFAYLKLLMTALDKLPSIKATIWRGINCDDTLTFVDNDVHLWWSITSCSRDLKIVEIYIGEKGTLFAIEAIHGKDISAFSAFSNELEIILIPGTHVRRKENCESLNYKDSFFIIHLEEEYLDHVLINEANDLSKRIKHEYQQFNRIERLMNPSKSFPMEQSYVNLAVVETKEQQEKEKKLLNNQTNNEIIISTYEEIYGTKTRIDIKDIFKKCTDSTKGVLVLGRAGIGKTTFCRYVTYRWAKGEIWCQYKLVILIQLRLLKTNRYPPGRTYSLIDLVQNQYFPCNTLSEIDRQYFTEQCDKGQVLWILDGYDEIVQNIPEHLKEVFDYIRKTQYHILTSRPYAIDLSYDVKMEIIGFTDDDITQYVEQFFDQITNEIDDASFQAKKLLNFLKRNPRVWGIAHIPVNLELICSLWCDTDWSETTTLTMTTIYDKMIEELCRRHLQKGNISSNQMTQQDVYDHLHNELSFLENLAFNGMNSKSIILPPKLLRMASKESKYSLQHPSNVLNIGILKSVDYKPIGTRIEPDKNHYFLHLSFQEHFAARYLVNTLNSPTAQKEKVLDFIKTNKYNQRFELVFSFVSGLLMIDSDEKQGLILFWETLLTEPLDLIGLKHIQIVISCLEEASCNPIIPQYRESLALIIKWINWYVCPNRYFLVQHLPISLRRSPSLVNQREVIDTFVSLYKDKDPVKRSNMCLFMIGLPIFDSSLNLTQLHLTALDDENIEVRKNVCKALGEMGEKAAVPEVIDKLIILLGDTRGFFGSNACQALEQISEKSSTDEVINRFFTLLCHQDNFIRSQAHEALGKAGKTAANGIVINRLLHLLDDTNAIVKSCACIVLRKIGKQAATNEVIHKLEILLEDENEYVRWNATEVLKEMTEKPATNEISDESLLLLCDKNRFIESNMSSARCHMNEKQALNKLIIKIMDFLRSTDGHIRSSACDALGIMGEKVATTEVLQVLTTLRNDKNNELRWSAYEALENMGISSTSDEMMRVLLDIAYQDESAINSIVCTRGQKILRFLTRTTDLKENTVQKLSMYKKKLEWCFLANFTPEKCIKAYLETEIRWWLPFTTRVIIMYGYGLNITETGVILLSNEEPVEIPFSTIKLDQDLRNYFTDWMSKSLHMLE
ncbi:unnamed protein product [Adineta steineri]|uniref:NAD(P)(+)--arginine ADP-ribosyltransferase n=1 Tax=Adineta steineri TaxID=433720 RepID=A0A819H3V3_9BILA|nr:unnamed protein product [Adineta steineri]CAF0834486.1 unnamed protein product [Adineta steineri]CAF3889606.1 unnamed protein product [Adineta steineri]CAF4025692.1 unnamed protein product [Adineta steineri]